MKKNFLMAMLAMGLVLAMAFTGCDEVLNEPEKGTETEVTGYGIISLDESDVICVFTFDPQGGDMGNVPKGSKGEVTNEIPYGDTAQKPSPDPTKTGFTFGGWYTDTACTKLYDFNTRLKGDFTVYAKWVPIPYKLTYSLNGAPGTPPSSLGNLTYGQTITEPAAPQWTGHTLVGWFRNADGTGKAWNFKTDTVTGYITLYAKWTLGDGPTTFAEAVADMKTHYGAGERNYTLEGGNESFTYKLILTTEVTSPAEVTIDGGGRVVTGDLTGDGNRITVGSGVTLTLTNITFTTLPFTVSDGGTLVLDTGAVVQGNAATGVTVSGTSATAKGTLEMKAGSSVTGNGISDVQNVGSGVRLEGTGSIFTMNGGSISNNSANESSGGGVALTGTNNVFTMSGGEISGNTAAVFIAAVEGSGGGGGVFMGGTNSVFIMSNGTISGNSAMWGGGVDMYGDDAAFTMSGGTISGNTVTQDGAGVEVYGEGAAFTMSGGFIKDNKAKYNGGGVYVYNTTFNMTGGEITGNEADGWNGSPGIGGVYAPAIGGNPWIGADKASGTGPGWIHDNTALDVIP